MPHSLAPSQILDRELLGILRQVDRPGRHAGPHRPRPRALAGDPRMAKIHRSLHVLLGESPGRAEQVLSIFSLPYEQGDRRKEEGGRRKEM